MKRSYLFSFFRPHWNSNRGVVPQRGSHKWWSHRGAVTNGGPTAGQSQMVVPQRSKSDTQSQMELLGRFCMMKRWGLLGILMQAKRCQETRGARRSMSLWSLFLQSHWDSHMNGLPDDCLLPMSTLLTKPSLVRPRFHSHNGLHFDTHPERMLKLDPNQSTGFAFLPTTAHTDSCSLSSMQD